MQGSLMLPQRLSLQSFATLHSYRTFGIRSVGSCGFPHWRTLGFGNPRASNSALQSFSQRRRRPGVVHDFLLEGTVMAKGLTFLGNTGYASMRNNCFAATPSCSYKAEVIGSGLNRAIATQGQSCGSVEKSSYRVPRPVQHHTALQWSSLHTRREYARKPFGRVAGKAKGQEVLVNEEEFEFKRIVSESESITTFYSSDKVEEDKERTAGKEKKTIAAEVDAEHSDIDDGVKRKDFKKTKKVKSLRKSDISKSVMDGQSDDITMKKGEILVECEDSDSESDDEPDEFRQTKEEKKAAKAEKDRLKSIKKDKKKQRKEAKKTEKESEGDDEMKLDYKGKNDEFDGEIERENVEEGEHVADVKTDATTKLTVNEDLATDIEYDEEGDGVTDFADDIEEDEENFVITEDKIATAGIENELADEIEEELDDLDEDDDFWDDDEGDVVVGDGGTGGGVLLGGTEWGKKALDLAEQVVTECGKDLSIFAFKISPDGVVRVRLDKLFDRYGSPSMTDIEMFSKRFTIALEESAEAGTVPKDIDVEVSSPGAERVVRVPDDLERFKELPMYVQYVEGETNQTEKDGVLELDSLDMDAGLSIWKIANVKLNREVKGRGRPLNSSQKKWRATVPFSSLKQVRLYLDV